MKFAHSRVNYYLSLALMTVGIASTVAIAPQAAEAANITGGKTTANPYVTNVAGNGGYEIIPLLTVGDEVSTLVGDFSTGFTTDSSKLYAFAGIPDGLGFYQSGGYNYAFVNHEISSNSFSFLNSTDPDKIRGARVSLFQFDQNWNVLGGKNLIETAFDSSTNTTYTLNTTTGSYEAIGAAALSFNRFCSGYLAESGFAGAPIWFAPEEAGSTSRGWAVASSGTNSGQAQALNGLGRYAQEQVISASQYRAGNSSGKTVLFSTEDFADGEIYMFVGQQTAEDPNGFKNGDLYVLKVDSADFEGSISGSNGATWTKVDDAASVANGTLLSNYVNANGRSTNFRRPEDISEDPNNPGTFYVVTTGTANQRTTNTTLPLSPNAATPADAENPYGRLYRFSLNPTDPTAPIDNFELLVEGGFGTGVSYDNIVVDSNGNVIIQEDETSFGGNVMTTENREARIWSYNIASKTIKPLFELDENAAGTQYNDPARKGQWESSGIVEVNPNAQPGRSSYLFDVQAHGVPSARYAEGGQLIIAKPVPEPGTTGALVIFGLSGLGLIIKQQRKSL